MSKHTPQEPTAGGKYKRDASGRLITQHQTQQVDGRTEASRQALAQRLAEDTAPDRATTTTDPQE